MYTLIEHFSDGSISITVFKSLPRQINTLTSLPTTLWLTRWQWSGHFYHLVNHWGPRGGEAAYGEQWIPQEVHPRKCNHLPCPCNAVIEDPNATVCLPYVHGISEPPIRVLKGLHIRTVMRPHQTLKQRLEYVRPKDVHPRHEKS